MREVIPDRLWIGNAMDVRDVARIHAAGITAVVDLAGEEPLPQLTRDLTYCRFPLVDGSDNPIELLACAVAATVRLMRSEIPLLVACSAGMSRSPAIVAAALSLVRSRSPHTLLQDLIAAAPHDISPPLWADVNKALDQLRRE